MIQAEQLGNEVMLRFGFDPIGIRAAKSIPGARLTVGGYIIPRDDFASFCEAVGPLMVNADASLRDIVPPDAFAHCKPTRVLSDLRPYKPTWSEQNTGDGLTEKDYQATGTTFLIEHKCALLLDEPGLGKTKQTIDAISYVYDIDHSQTLNVLIVAKASSLHNWRNEIEMFAATADVRVLNGSSRQRQLSLRAPLEAGITYNIVSWQSMRADISVLSRIAWDWIVLDEAHMAKSTPINNAQAKQASAIHALQAPRKIALTGTFIINSAEDTWNVLRWLGVEKRGWKTFEHETLKTIQYDRGQNRLKLVVGYHIAGLQTLRKLVGANMIRRLKDDELPSLPPYIETNVEVMLRPEESAAYREAEHQLLLTWNTKDETVRKSIDESALVLRLKQITSSLAPFLGPHFVSSKVATAKSLVEDLVDGGQKVIIGTQFRSVVDSLARELGEFNPAIVHGGISTASKAGELSARDIEVQRFQTDPTCHVFVASVAACREAINLTEASAIIDIDKEWSQAYVDQFHARARRIGSEKHRAINVYSLLAVCTPTRKHPRGEKTIDFGLDVLRARKSEIADGIVSAKH